MLYNSLACRGNGYTFKFAVFNNHEMVKFEIKRIAIIVFSFTNEPIFLVKHVANSWVWSGLSFGIWASGLQERRFRLGGNQMGRIQPHHND